MTEPNLLDHFSELKKECGWDGDLTGTPNTAVFKSANRKHMDEFIGLSALVPGAKVTDISWTMPLSTNGWAYCVSLPSGKVTTQAHVSSMLKSNFRG